MLKSASSGPVSPPTSPVLQTEGSAEGEWVLLLCPISGLSASYFLFVPHIVMQSIPHSTHFFFFFLPYPCHMWDRTLHPIHSSRRSILLEHGRISGEGGDRAKPSGGTGIMYGPCYTGASSRVWESPSRSPPSFLPRTQNGSLLGEEGYPSLSHARTSSWLIFVDLTVSLGHPESLIHS